MLAGVDDKNPDEIMNLFLKEQLLETLNPELEVFVRDHAPKTAIEVAELAERHSQAKWESKKPKRPKGEGQTQEEEAQSDENKGGPKPSSVADKECYNCHQKVNEHKWWVQRCSFVWSSAVCCSCAGCCATLGGPGE
jgi:hypothetical protein